MICVFFIGIGIASVGASSAQSPLGIAVWLFILGVFASIYHPVGLALIAKGGQKMGRDIAVNGVWGNMGVGFAAFMTGLMIDYVGWRAAFWLPGLISIGIGVLYFMDFRENILIKLKSGNASVTSETSFMGNNDRQLRRLMIRVSVIIFFTTAVSAIIFQSTTFALPKVFDERLGIISDSASAIGFMALFCFRGRIICTTSGRPNAGQDRSEEGLLSCVFPATGFFHHVRGSIWLDGSVVATLFMLGAFGQIPINDYMIGKMAKSEFRASIYGVRFVVSFAVWAVVVPLISLVHETMVSIFFFTFSRPARWPFLLPRQCSLRTYPARSLPNSVR